MNEQIIKRKNAAKKRRLYLLFRFFVVISFSIGVIGFYLSIKTNTKLMEVNKKLDKTSVQLDESSNKLGKMIRGELKKLQEYKGQVESIKGNYDELAQELIRLDDKVQSKGAIIRLYNSATRSLISFTERIKEDIAFINKGKITK